MRQLSARQKRSRLLTVSAVFCLLSIFVMGTVLCLTDREISAPFVPPEFDPAAQVGSPSVPEDLNYREVYREGMGFSSKVCATVTAEGNTAVIYFTNPKENTVWLKLRMMAADGTVLGETGLIRPGEYVRSVVLKGVPVSGSGIKLKIMAYEPETYHSEGSAVLNTVFEGASN